MQLCQHALEQPDPSQLDQLFEECIDADAAGAVADILALPVAQRGHATIIDVLADNGAEFSKLDFHRGGPPLMHAANNGHAATVSALLKVFSCSHSILACWLFGSHQHNGAQRSLTIACCLQRGADISATDRLGQTALMVAVFSGDCLATQISVSGVM